MTDSDVRPTGLSTSQILGYAAGDVANNLTFQMVAMFLLLYYTDVVGIPAATAGAVLLGVRVWGGISDLIAGRAADHTSTRWGKFRPYLLFGSIPLLVSWWRRSPFRVAWAAPPPSCGPSPPTPSSPSPTASSTSPTGRWRRS